MSDDTHTFRYHDGAAEVHGDPAALRRALLLKTGGKLNALLSDYYAGNRAKKKWAKGEGPESPEMQERREQELAAAELIECKAALALLPIVREAFGLKPFDPATGQGATDDDADAVLCAFLDYLHAVKKKHATSPLTAPPTEPEPPADPSPPKNGSGSLLTGALPLAGTPRP